MPILRTLDQTLGTLERGQLVQDYQARIDALLQVLAPLGERDKVKGSVTLKLEFTVEASVTEIRATLTSKTPAETRPLSLLFVLPDGRISTEHPRQLDMFAGPRAAAADG